MVLPDYVMLQWRGKKQAELIFKRSEETVSDEKSTNPVCSISTSTLNVWEYEYRDCNNLINADEDEVSDNPDIINSESNNWPSDDGITSDISDTVDVIKSHYNESTCSTTNNEEEMYNEQNRLDSQPMNCLDNGLEFSTEKICFNFNNKATEEACATVDAELIGVEENKNNKQEIYTDNCVYDTMGNEIVENNENDVLGNKVKCECDATNNEGVIDDVEIKLTNLKQLYGSCSSNSDKNNQINIDSMDSHLKEIDNVNTNCQNNKPKENLKQVVESFENNQCNQTKFESIDDDTLPSHDNDDKCNPIISKINSETKTNTESAYQEDDKVATTFYESNLTKDQTGHSDCNDQHCEIEKTSIDQSPTAIVGAFKDNYKGREMKEVNNTSQISPISSSLCETGDQVTSTTTTKNKAKKSKKQRDSLYNKNMSSTGFLLNHLKQREKGPSDDNVDNDPHHIDSETQSISTNVTKKLQLINNACAKEDESTNNNSIVNDIATVDIIEHTDKNIWSGFPFFLLYSAWTTAVTSLSIHINFITSNTSKVICQISSLIKYCQSFIGGLDGYEQAKAKQIQEETNEKRAMEVVGDKLADVLRPLIKYSPDMLQFKLQTTGLLKYVKIKQNSKGYVTDIYEMNTSKLAYNTTRNKEQHRSNDLEHQFRSDDFDQLGDTPKQHSKILLDELAKMELRIDEYGYIYQVIDPENKENYVDRSDEVIDAPKQDYKNLLDQLAETEIRFDENGSPYQVTGSVNVEDYRGRSDYTENQNSKNIVDKHAGIEISFDDDGYLYQIIDYENDENYVDKSDEIADTTKQNSKNLLEHLTGMDIRFDESGYLYQVTASESDESSQNLLVELAETEIRFDENGCPYQVNVTTSKNHKEEFNNVLSVPAEEEDKMSEGSMDYGSNNKDPKLDYDDNDDKEIINYDYYNSNKYSDVISCDGNKQKKCVISEQMLEYEVTFTHESKSEQNKMNDDEDESETCNPLEKEPPYWPISCKQYKSMKKNLHKVSYFIDSEDVTPEGFPEELQKYWVQRHRLFLKYDEGIMLDYESWFSVTPEMLSAHQANRSRCQVVVDAFCGAGGNAIQLARTCQQVVAIDIDPEKIKLARHNAEVYGVADNIRFFCADFFEIAPKLKADVVFLSPPWGGIEYNERRTGNYDVFTLEGAMDCKKLMKTAYSVSQNIVLYLPRNSNVYQIIQLAEPRIPVDIEFNYISNKLKAITAYYGPIANYSSFNGSCFTEER